MVYDRHRGCDPGHPGATHGNRPSSRRRLGDSITRIVGAPTRARTINRFESSKRMFLKLPLRRAPLTLLLVGLLTACTTQSTLPLTPMRESTPTTAQTGPTCQTSQLTLAYDRSDGLVANRADQFSLQNTSTSMCTLFGYPHVQMLLADGHPTPTHVTQATSAYLFRAALKVVSLQAGAKAYFVVEWVAGTCADYASTAGMFLQVTPPGGTGTLTTSTRAGIDGGIDACGKIVVSPISEVSVLL